MRIPLPALCLLLLVLNIPAWAALPKVSNPTAVPKSGGTATLSAVVSAGGSSAIVTFRYGLTTSYGSVKLTNIEANATDAVVSVDIDGLQTGSTYNYRVEVVNAENPDNPVVTANQTFVQTATVVLNSALHRQPTATQITLRGVVVPNGVAGTAFFEYSENSNFTPLLTVPLVPQVILGTETSVTVSAALPDADLTAGPIYNVRLVFLPAGAVRANAIVSTVGKTNTAPKALADSETQVDVEPITIAVTENDSDAENDTLTVTAATRPRYGTVTFTGTTVTYTPTQALLTADTFRYTISDGFGLTASATVTIRPLRLVLGGTHGGLIRNAEGKEIGYFRITATALGSFTGVVEIDGKSYILGGTFAPDGSFRGAASRDGTIMPVTLTTVLGENGTTIQAEFAQGKYTSTVDFTDDEAATRGPLAGRYTVELPSGTSGTDNGGTGDDPTSTSTLTNLPEGTGWTALKVLSDGSVRVKGRLPDGRAFSTRGALVVGEEGPQITFYDDLPDTRVFGTFDIGDTVTGSFQVDRARSNDEVFPEGYEATITVNGARYVPPDDGGGIVSSTGEGADEFTISFSGGGLSSSFSRNVRLTDAGQFKVIDGGREELKVKVDPSSGRFTTKVTVDDNGRRVKGTGVFIQGSADASSGGGAGVFKGVTRPGSIQITAGSTPTPSTPVPSTPVPGTPLPTPVPGNGIIIQRPNGTPASVR